jgi:hypothetical protein
MSFLHITGKHGEQQQQQQNTVPPDGLPVNIVTLWREGPGH